MTYHDIVKDINKMPQLSDISMDIQSLYASGSENVNIRKLVKLIESDITLTANLLKVINSPFYGFQSKISSISQAVSLFGVNKIYALVIHFAMSNFLKVDTEIYGFNNNQFNDMCILQSSLMMQWYAKINLRDSHILTSLALIMESGKLIVAKELYGSDYLEVYREGFLACDNISEFEKSFFGTTSYYLSSLLFEHWNFDQFYSMILKALDTPNDMEDEQCSLVVQKYAGAIDVIRTAINLKEVLTPESIEKAAHKVKMMGLDEKHFEKVAQRIRKKFEEL